MITQAIKGWFKKAFAWWPWKQSLPIEYPHVASAVSRGAAPETPLRASQEEGVPQAGATPRRFTLENRIERLAQPRAETPEMPPLSPSTFSHTGAETAKGASEEVSPSPQQRLEFLRYLVRRGLVNEGFEEDHADDHPG
jgi:hypothetical protein